jgi:transcriptional regulator with XRE-family HTH domain
MTLSDTAQAERVGSRIRDMRRARSFTLVQLAEAAELSHPFLSQLERGLASPSMASLERIARALGTSQVELLSVDEPRRGRGADAAEPVSIVRAGTGTQGPYSEGSARMLVDGARAFHPMEFHGDNVAYGDSFAHDEDEWMYVLDGNVEVDLGVASPLTFAPGDAVYLTGGTAHRLRSADGGPFRLLIVKEHPARL